jgi:tetratricopeptide (TPR) repeat protein
MLKGVALGFAAAALVAGPASANWVEAKTDHFVIYGDMPEAKAADYARKVERFDRILRMFANVSESGDAPIDRVVVYVLPSLTAVRSLANSSSIAGFYNGNVQSTLAVMPGSMPAEYQVSPLHILFHEYTHHILLSSTTASYPGWIQEGFAEFFGTALPKDDGSMLIGSPPQMRGYALHRQYQMPVEALLTSDGRKLSDGDTEDKYARGWLLSHYLLLGNKRRGQIDEYLRLIRQGVPSLEAGKRAFGDLGKLNAELTVYNRTNRFPALLVAADKIRVGGVATRELRPCEGKIMRSRIRSAIGVTEKTAPQLVAPARAVAAECPNDVFVQRSLAEIEFDAKNNDAAMTAADRTLALDPGNIMGMVYKGRVLARQGQWAEARKWFVKANRANPDYALPLVLYYDSFMRSNQAPTPAAVKGLLRAIVLVPQDDSLRLRVGYALLRQGDLATARAVLAPIAFSAHARPDNPALLVVRKLDEGAGAKAALAEADKAKWNEIGKE